MANRQGIKKLYCDNCGKVREVEVGIRQMYCCATPMKEVYEDEAEELRYKKDGSLARRL